MQKEKRVLSTIRHNDAPKDVRFLYQMGSTNFNISGILIMVS